MNRSLFKLFACVAALLAWGTSDLYAQGAVSRIVVPFAAGGGQDVLARVIAPQLSAELGETFIIENRAGAGGAVGTSFVARSKPDGMTMLMAASSHTITAALDPATPYEPVKDFTAVAHIGTGAYIFLVNANLPVHTVAEFIARAKANPGRINYASAGVGSATHLAMAYFSNLAGVDLVHVPFKSTAEAANSLIGGDTQALIVPLLGSQAFVANPALRLLAVVSKTRVANMPDVPTVDESGLPGFEFSSWFGLVGPAGMPPDVTAKINAAAAKVVAMPEIAAAIRQQGVEPKTMSSASFAELVADNFVSMKKVVKAAGLAAP
jgi:tripartite-type tricarboxylate transporter receptor subunit TctC